MGEDRGVGWWQASDGEWYPPERHPDYQRLVDETRRHTAAREVFGPPAGDETNPKLFNATRWKLSPYALIAIVFGLAGLLAFFLFGFRLWLFALGAAVLFVWKARQWTDDGNGGAAMGRVAKWVVVASVVPPVGVIAVAVASSITDDVTAGPPPWELERGQCIEMDPPENPDDEPPNWLRVKVVDCADEHIGQVVLVTNMGIGQRERVAATQAPDATEYWDDLAAAMCDERVGDDVWTSLDETTGVGNMRWYFEYLTREKDPPGYGFLVCLAMHMDGSPMVGSVLTD